MLRTLNCEVFIDDLPEDPVLGRAFPAGLRAILFDPEGHFPRRRTSNPIAPTGRDCRGPPWVQGLKMSPRMKRDSCAACGPPGQARWTSRIRSASSGLDGGKNNQVYRVDRRRQERRALRAIISSIRAMIATVWRQNGAFLSFAWRRGLRDRAEPLACDVSVQRRALRVHRGRKLAAGELDADTSAAAIDFILALNAAPRSPDAFAPASEACFHARRASRHR